jgi:hypothetical protein
MTARAERRRYPRYRTDLPVALRDQTEREYEGRCNIIAEGGLGANLAHPLPVGSVVLVRFGLPTHPSMLELWAVVRYREGQQHGLEFVSLADPQKLSLMQFCNQLALNEGVGRRKQGAASRE